MAESGARSTDVLAGPPEGAQRLSAGHVLERLSEVDVLRSLPPEEVQAVVPYMTLVTFPAGDTVLRQGETGDALYVVDEGNVRVRLEIGTDLGVEGPGEAFGEMALLTGEPRAATVVAETPVKLLRLGKDDFDRVVQQSPRFKAAFEELAERHRAGLQVEHNALADGSWRGTALRAMAAQSKGLKDWQIVMGVGFLLWAALFIGESLGRMTGIPGGVIALINLVAGLTIIQGAAEAFIVSVERAGARLHWDGFISGTVGSLVSTIPEFVVIAFLVGVDPVAAFVTAAVTIFNNALAFSLYSFFLPKDVKGRFVMPESLASAGSEVLIAGSGIAMIVGVLMLALRAQGTKTALSALDLLVVGIVLTIVYGYYTYTLVRYYSEAEEEENPSVPPDPDRLGHDTSWRAISLMFVLGLVGAFIGGEAIGGFADTALNQLGLPVIPTAAGLAFFAGISEYIIVLKAHSRGELGIALSNTFGGITQVMFLLLPFTMIVIALLAFRTGQAIYSIPIDTNTTLLMLLLFPLFYVLLGYLEKDHTLNNLDAASMTGIYGILLYFLFTA